MSTQQIEVGDVVELTTHVDRGRKGDRFVVEFYDEGFVEGDEEFGNPDYLQGPILEGWVRHGTCEVEASNVTLVTKAADVKEPTAKQVAESLRLDGDEYEAHEWGPEGDGDAYFMFTDENDQEWTAFVRVVGLQKEI